MFLMFSIMDSFRKWFYKPRKDDTSYLAQFFHADEALNLVAAELDSFDGRKDPERCTTLVAHLRMCQDKVLNICNRIMDEVIPNERANRDFRVKFPDDVMQDNLAGQLWFGAECLAAGSSIMNKETESVVMRPLAKALTKSLDMVRRLLREAALRSPNLEQVFYCDPGGAAILADGLKVFDSLLAEFELAYVSAMVPVKSNFEYEIQQCVIVLFSETLQRALAGGLLTQDMVDQCEPGLMFTIPRLAIVAGLVVFPHGPLSLDPFGVMSDMFSPFRTLLVKIRELLWTLTEQELLTLEKMLCSSEDPVSSNTTSKPIHLPSIISCREEESWSDVVKDGDCGPSNVWRSIPCDCAQNEPPNSDNRTEENSDDENHTNNNLLREKYSRNWDKLRDDSSACLPQDIDHQSSSHQRREHYSGSFSSCSSFKSSSSPASISVSSDTSSFNSEYQDEVEVALAVKAAEINCNRQARARFKSSEDLLHRLFVCISGVADQLQTNFAGDLRNILKAVFLINASDSTEFETTDNQPPGGEYWEQGEDVVAMASGGSDWAGGREDWAAPVWVPDEEAPSCMACTAPFTVIRRRHHCRNCGKVFCSRCSSNSVPLPRFGHHKPVRVCNRCFIYQLTPFPLEHPIPTATPTN